MSLREIWQENERKKTVLHIQKDTCFSHCSEYFINQTLFGKRWMQFVEINERSVANSQMKMKMKVSYLENKNMQPCFYFNNHKHKNNKLIRVPHPQSILSQMTIKSISQTLSN